MTLVATTRTEKEEDKEEEREKIFYFSKTKGLILESENIFFLGKKEDDHGLLAEEVR